MEFWPKTFPYGTNDYHCYGHSCHISELHFPTKMLSSVLCSRRQSFTDRLDLAQAEQDQSSIAPTVQGRIYHIDDMDSLQRHRLRFTTATDEELIAEMHCWKDGEVTEEEKGGQ